MSKKSLHLNISGMTCVNCSNAIENITKLIDGVDEAKVNFASSNGKFIYDDKKIDKKIITKKIQSLGYGIADDLQELERQKKADLKKLKMDFFISLALSICVMALDRFHLFGTLNSIVIFVLASIVQFYCGMRFYTHAYGALKNKNYDMNVLVALGTSVAYGYSAFVVFFGEWFKYDYVYFNGSVAIITFILLGKYLEERSKASATDFLKKLIDLSPKNATILKDEKEEEVLASSLQIGDKVVVKSGENISADGIIISGSGDVDTSMITGEAMPVFKQIGDEVIAGTINTNGYFTLKVTKTSTNNTLSHIVSLLGDAQNQKMPIGRFADKVANIFVPTVITISIVTFLCWLLITGDFISAFLALVSVLIISCPCALGLATPIAIVSAVGKGAKEGIFIKNPEILEIIKDIKYAIFDKTGTLTKGEISVKESFKIDEKNLSFIKALEEKSEHPISKAIVNFINSDKFHEVQDLEILPGLGIKGKVDEKNIIVGNEKLLAKNHITLSNETKEFLQDTQKSSHGIVLVAVDGKEAGAFSLSDELKSNAKEVIEQFKNMDIEPIMITGDSKANASHLSKKVGIDEIYADVLPDQKYELVKKIQKNGKVLFVGDGINDSISLKQADIGIALSSGSDIAKDAGDIILMSNDLQSVVKSVRLSQLTMRNIKENLFWAFFYNAIGIPLAAGVFYPILGVMLTPMYAGIAMSFSSVSVVLNSLRLRFKKI